MKYSQKGDNEQEASVTRAFADEGNEDFKNGKRLSMELSLAQRLHTLSQHNKCNVVQIDKFANTTRMAER